MGQYYKTCNIDKRELLHPHDLGDGLKLLEFGMSGRGTLTALASLLIMDRQGVGAWAGNRIVIAGDYADEGRFVPKEYAGLNLYAYSAANEDGDMKEPALVDGDAVARAPLMPFRRVTEDANVQLQFLGFEDIVLRSRNTADLPLLWENRKYDQPEDLLDAMQVDIVENLKFVMSDVARTLRVCNVKSGVAWQTVDDVQLTLDDATGRATQLDVRWRDRDTGALFSTSLKFPATSNAVRKFLKVQDKEPPALANSKTKQLTT